MSGQGGVDASTNVPDEGGLVLPENATEGRTIAGLVYKDGVILGVGSRTIEGKTDVADTKSSLTIHDISPNILCYREGSHADPTVTTNMIASNAALSNLSLPETVTGNLLTVKRVLEERLFQYQGHSSTSNSNSKGHGKAALVLGRVDDSGPHLYVYDPQMRKVVPKEHVSMGPGSSEYVLHPDPNMEKHEAMRCVRDALADGILKDLDSAPTVDLFIIKKDNQMEYRLPYRRPRPTSDFQEGK